MQPSYGHDIHGALLRGHIRRAQSAADALLEQETYLHPRRRGPGVLFRAALSHLVSVAGARGVSEDSIRWAMTDLLERTDSTRIARLLEPSQLDERLAEFRAKFELPPCPHCKGTGAQLRDEQ